MLTDGPTSFSLFQYWVIGHTEFSGDVPSEVEDDLAEVEHGLPANRLKGLSAY